MSVTGSRRGRPKAWPFGWMNADSLRLDENTTVEIVSKNRFVLGSGRVYADTGEGIYRDTWLVIDTEMASSRTSARGSPSVSSPMPWTSR